MKMRRRFCNSLLAIRSGVTGARPLPSVNGIAAMVQSPAKVPMAGGLAGGFDPNSLIVPLSHTW